MGLIPRVRRCAATLGFGIKRLRRITNSDMSVHCQLLASQPLLQYPQMMLRVADQGVGHCTGRDGVAADCAHVLPGGGRNVLKQRNVRAPQMDKFVDQL